MVLRPELDLVPNAPDKVFYVPNFVSEEEEEYISRKIQESPLPKWKNLPNRRLQVWGGEIKPRSNTLIPSPLPSWLVTYPDIIPRLQALGIFSSSPVGQPNHVIINEYLSGQGIMPHEDGPSYHPVVATISMGSHTVMNYYRYRPMDPSDIKLDATTTTARSIEPEPVLSLLLEPRSLVITTAGLYTNHLHGIDPSTHDKFSLHADEDTGLNSSEPNHGIRVANWNMIRSDEMKSVLAQGGTLERGTRVSLTCRVVEKVTPALNSFGRK